MRFFFFSLDDAAATLTARSRTQRSGSDDTVLWLRGSSQSYSWQRAEVTFPSSKNSKVNEDTRQFIKQQMWASVNQGILKYCIRKDWWKQRKSKKNVPNFALTWGVFCPIWIGVNARNGRRNWKSDDVNIKPTTDQLFFHFRSLLFACCSHRCYFQLWWCF